MASNGNLRLSLEMLHKQMALVRGMMDEATGTPESGQYAELWNTLIDHRVMLIRSCFDDAMLDTFGLRELLRLIAEER